MCYTGLWKVYSVLYKVIVCYRRLLCVIEGYSVSYI